MTTVSKVGTPKTIARMWPVSKEGLDFGPRGGGVDVGEGDAVDVEDEDVVVVSRVVGIGKELDEEDTAGSVKVVIISEALRGDEVVSSAAILD